VDRSAAEAWIRAHVAPVGPIETAHRRPWSTVLRVPLAGTTAWFKACAPLQAFEPRLTADLSARWPDRAPHVLAHDAARRWLLLADAGVPLQLIGNPPQRWLQLLPRYADLQRGEAQHAEEHRLRGVPDLRLITWLDRFGDLLAHDLPLDDHASQRLRRLAPRFSALCDELAAYRVPDTIQHDDLHMRNVYLDGECLRMLDWGDACVSHPFVSLVVTFRFLEEVNHLRPDDPWFARLRDAYLEGWGRGYTDAFRIAMRAGALVHTFGWMRQRQHLPQAARADFDQGFARVLRRALRQLERS
jgi:hypothetical protein